MSRRGFNDPAGSSVLNQHLSAIDGITQNLTSKGTVSSKYVDGLFVTEAQLAPVAIAATTHGPEQTFAVPGLVFGSVLLVTKPTVQTGLLLVQSRVTSNNTLGLTFYNLTGAPITPAQEVYLIAAFSVT